MSSVALLVVGACWLPFDAARAMAPVQGTGGQTAHGIELVALPVPNLEPEDEAVREQLNELRRNLDAALADAANDGASHDRDELARAFGELGGLYYFYDLRDAGYAALVNASRLAPEEPRWHYLKGVLLILQGRLADADRAFGETLRLVPDASWAQYRRGSARLDLARYEEADADFRRVLQQNPDHAAALGGLGNVLVQMGREAEAVPLFERALEIQPGASSFYFGLGAGLRALGRLPEAREALSKNRQGRPTFFDPWIDEVGSRSANSEGMFHAGNRAMRAGSREEAIRHFEAFLRDQPNHRSARLSLALAYIESNRVDEGLRRLSELIEDDPRARGAARLMAETLAGVGRFEESLPYFEKAHELDPEELSTVADWATVLATLGRKQEALDRLGPLIEGKPHESYGRLKFATILSTTDRVQEARTMLEELALAPGLRDSLRAEAWYHLGSLDLRRRDEEGARTAWERSLELDPDNRLTLAALAPAMARSGDLTASIDLHRRWSKQAPQDDRARFGLAMALLLDGREAAARDELESAARALPEQVALRHLLARLLAASTDAEVRDGDRALALSRELLRAHPGPDVAETLAMALAEVGDFEQAVELQRTIIERARQRGTPSSALRALEERLQTYSSGQPVRAPWRGGS